LARDDWVRRAHSRDDGHRAAALAAAAAVAAVVAAVVVAAAVVAAVVAVVKVAGDWGYS
jgi:hypothetical protein